MIKRNDQGQIVKMEVEEYPVSREAIVKKRDELAADWRKSEKDLADFDALTSEASTPIAPDSTLVEGASNG